MANHLYISLTLFILIFVISAGCMTPPSSKTEVTPTITRTTKATTSPTPSPTPLPPQLPMFNVGHIALTQKDGASGLAIVNSISAINMYGTVEVKREKVGNVVVWYTEGMQIVMWKNFADVDRKYKFFEYGMDPTRIPYYRTGQELSVIEAGACDALGDWNINDGSIYKLRADGIAVKQITNETKIGKDIKIGRWKSLRTSEGRSYVIEWDYGPSPDYPLFVEKITVSKDLTKFDGVDNYGRKFTGNWAYTTGPMGTVKKCSDWLGSDDWYKDIA